MPKKFSGKLISENNELIYRVNGFKGETKRWYYIFVQKSKLSSFKKALESGDINVAEYGEILAWGEGENPPKDVITTLEDKYKIKIIN